jgi:uncharacterized protein YdiU (UPF0061 family)
MNKSEDLIKQLEKNMPAPPPPPKKDEVQDDYEFSRETYRSLVNKSNEAIEQMLSLAMQSEHPRAFEVLSNMLKNTSDMTDKLMALQKAKKDMAKKEEADAKPALTQNNLFLGSTTDLQKHLIQKLKEQNVTDAEQPDVRQER